MAHSSGGQREHRPDELGPRILRRGRWYAADLRPWGGGRPTLRNPTHPQWPKKGDRTEDEDIARRWAWAYVDLHRGNKRARILGYGGPATSLGEALDRWLRHRERNVAATTLRSTGTAAKHLRAALGASTPVAEIGRPEMQAMFDALMDEGYADSTLRTMLGYLGAFFAWLEVPDNPARAVVLPKAPDTDVVTWTDAELVRLREAADRIDAAKPMHAPVRRMLELAVSTGARQGELYALRWTDFDPDARTVRIARQVDLYGGLKPPKGKRSRDALVLPEWWPHHDPDAEGYVLPMPNGQPTTRGKQAQMIERLLDTANLNEKGVGHHRFRHTYGRLFVERGGEPWQLKDSLGHRSITTTERDYGSFAGDMATRIARAAIYGEGGLRRIK